MALTDKLTAIANAIRTKTGKTSQMSLDQMATEISGITVGGDEELQEGYIKLDDGVILPMPEYDKTVGYNMAFVRKSPSYNKYYFALFQATDLTYSDSNTPKITAPFNSTYSNKTYEYYTTPIDDPGVWTFSKKATESTIFSLADGASVVWASDSIFADTIRSYYYRPKYITIL